MILTVVNLQAAGAQAGEFRDQLVQGQGIVAGSHARAMLPDVEVEQGVDHAA